MTKENKHTGLPVISPMRQKCKTCPFCGSIPYIGLGKQGSCQLHGEPFQSVIVHCKSPVCYARPSISGGDIYNGGKEKAELEAIKIWNRRADNNEQALSEARDG